MKDMSWRVAFVICAAAAAVPLLVTYRLPMADLPQHAVQLTVWKYFDHDCYRFRDLYEINWFTPYLLGTTLMRVVAGVVSVHAALKFVVFATILLFVLVLRRFTDFAGVDPWIALLGFPLSFGFSFYWGFVNFNVAVPIGLILILTIVRTSEGEKVGVIRVALLALLVAAAHALLYGLTLIIAGPLLLVRAFRQKGLWLHVAALCAPMPLLALWIVKSVSGESRARAPWDWQVHPRRLLQVFDFMLSAGGDVDGFWFSIVMVGAAVLLGMSMATNRWRALPFIAALAGFLLCPLAAFGQTFLYPRLAIFIPATAILALRDRPIRFPKRIARILIAAVVLTWIAVLSARFAIFHRDADGFDRLVDIMPPNQRVLLLNVVQSAEMTGMPFIHFSGYYLERKGGIIGWSFASNFPPVIRYRPGVNPGVWPIVTHDPRYFNWKQHSNFDFFIIRAPVDMTTLIFGDGTSHVRFLRREGMWWLYERQAAHTRQQCPPLVRDGDHRPVLNLSGTIE